MGTLMAKLSEGVSLSDIKAMADEIASRRKDYIFPASTEGRGVNRRPTGVRSPGLTDSFYTLPEEKDINGCGQLYLPGTDESNFKIEYGALSHICAIADPPMPTAYLERVMHSKLSDVREIARKVINTNLAHIDKGVMVRALLPQQSLDNVGMPTIYAVPSANYLRFDCDKILGVLLDTCGDNMDVRGYYVDHRRLEIRLTEKEPLDIDGDPHFVGIRIKSGDASNGTLIVTFFLYRQICTNGMMFEKLSGKVCRRRHLGSYNEESFAAELREAIELLPVFRDKIKEILEISREKNLTSEELKSYLEKFKENTGKLSQEQEKALDNCIITYSPTLWGFVNALTEFAQHESFNLDAREKIEAYASSFLLAGVGA